VNVVEKPSPGIAWSTLPTETDAWIHTLYWSAITIIGYP
jgi:hypothetical protein